MGARARLNLEGSFALLVLLGSVIACVFRRRNETPPHDGTTPRREWLLLLLVIPAAFCWTPAIPLISDDYVHIAAGLHFKFDQIADLFTVPESNLFFRPLGYISFAVDALWAGRDVTLWHLSSLLLHLVNCVLLYLLARQMGFTRFFAAVAAAIFGIHGSRPEAVTWTAGRFDLLATLFVLATILLFRRGKDAAALATALLALISKESAYLLPILLLLVTDSPHWRRAAPFAALTAAVFLYRWHVLSGIGGYQTGARAPAILNFSFLHTLNALGLRLWATLFFPINWSDAAEWWLWMGMGLGVMGYAAIGWHGCWQRPARTFLLFTFIAALPVQHLLLIGADLEKSRVLYLPSVGFALCLAALLETLCASGWRIPAAIAIMAFQVACLEHNLIIWREVAQTARRTCDSLAASLAGNNTTVTTRDLPNVLRGVYFSNGMAECVELNHGIDPERVRRD
jgi:hypothetical protein